MKTAANNGQTRGSCLIFDVDREGEEKKERKINC